MLRNEVLVLGVVAQFCICLCTVRPADACDSLIGLLGAGSVDLPSESVKTVPRKRLDNPRPRIASQSWRERRGAC